MRATYHNDRLIVRAGLSMTISRLRVSAATLQSRIHEAAQSSSNVVFIPPLERKSMAGMMTFHQALLCLQQGSIVGKPTLNNRGDWELTMSRRAADHDFQSRVVAVCDGPRIARIFVLLSGT